MCANQPQQRHVGRRCDPFNIQRNDQSGHQRIFHPFLLEKEHAEILLLQGTVFDDDRMPECVKAPEREMNGWDVERNS